MSIKLTKIYTKTGDKGTTALISGRRVSKACQQMECVGTVDELNTIIGIIRTHADSATVPAVTHDSEQTFKKIQNKLFDIGSLLAMDHQEPMETKFAVTDENVAFLENKIDFYNDSLEPLNSFTLPGGCLLNAYAHQARTVCRRAERELFRLADELDLETEEKSPTPLVDPGILRYVNRLSDYLFVYSRWVSKELRATEYLWEY